MSDEHDEVARASTAHGALPVAPSMGPALEAAEMPRQGALVTQRTLVISALAITLAFIAAMVAQLLMRLIWLVTNIAFHHRFSVAQASPADNHLGLAVIAVPVIGGLIVGVMARWGSQAIRGHGIPEAMERVLEHGSKIPARLTFLKPLSAAVAIGTGGPFGAEGPIIATGGSIGSLIGQVIRTTAHERKTLLAAGAAAGMTATFGSPVSAVLLAVELLLFELSPRSLIPVSLACAVAAAVRIAWVGVVPVFQMPVPLLPGGAALTAYIVIGGLLGLISVFVTRAVYAVEDAFEKLPIHFMWWPALGAIAVGVVGYFAPHTMGVGYDNIEQIVAGHIVGKALAILFVLKFISWAISLGSGTSGGTLAPLFTIGGGIGSLLGMAAAALLPEYGIDLRVAALVGMAALFAGCSRALLASIVFAFETTRQPMGLLPLLGGCTAAYLVSAGLMRESIMTTKIARRGVRVPVEFGSDVLEQTHVAAFATKDVVALKAEDKVESVRAMFATKGSLYSGYPVIDDHGTLLGVVMRRDLEQASDSAKVRELITRPPITIGEDATLREAVELMASERIGRLPVMSRSRPGELVALLSSSDLIRAYRKRIDEQQKAETHIPLPIRSSRRPPAA